MTRGPCMATGTAENQAPRTTTANQRDITNAIIIGGKGMGYLLHCILQWLDLCMWNCTDTLTIYII